MTIELEWEPHRDRRWTSGRYTISGAGLPVGRYNVLIDGVKVHGPVCLMRAKRWAETHAATSR